MSDTVSTFGSDRWIPDLKILCFDFLKNLQKRPGGRFLKFRDEIGTLDKPGRIIEEYHKTANILKRGIYGSNAIHANMDHHKIAALYIRSFLMYKPFFFDVPDETKYFEICLYTKLANEYFSIPFMAALFKSWNNDFDGKLEMDATYKDQFIKLLYSYKKDIQNLNPLALSNIIYLIEQHYFKRSGATDLYRK